MKRSALLLVGILANISLNPTNALANDYEFGITNCVSGDDVGVRSIGCKYKIDGSWKTVLWSDLPAHNEPALLKDKEYYVERVELDHVKQMSVTVYYRYRDKIEIQY